MPCPYDIPQDSQSFDFQFHNIARLKPGALASGQLEQATRPDRSRSQDVSGEEVDAA